MDSMVPLTASIAAVHADALEEHGHHARADFIRTSLQFEALTWAEHLTEKTALGVRLATLERAQWAEACGALKVEHTWVGWKHGLPVELGLARLDAAAVQALAAMPWLEHLAFGAQARVPLSGVEQLSSLRRLHFWWCPDVTHGLSGATLPSLDSLSLEAPDAVRRSELVALATMRAPSLRRLITRARDAAFLFSGIGAANWFSQLSSWSHVVSSRDELTALLQSPALKLAGPVLTLRVPAALAEGLTLPHGVRLSVARAVPRYNDPEWSHDPVAVTAAPRERGLQWLPPWVDTTPRDQNETGVYCPDSGHGSGVPFEGRAKRSVSWCGLCESENTRLIRTSSSAFYSHFETTSSSSWDYRCLDCGLFSASGDSTVR